MRYAKNNFSNTHYKKTRSKLFRENCYCQPFNSPLEIKHVITLELLQRVFCDPTISGFYYNSIDYANLSSTTFVTIPNTDVFVTGTTLNTTTFFLQLHAQIPLDCFYLVINLQVTNAANPSGVNMQLVTEPYCQVGTSSIQKIVASIPVADINTASVVKFANGCYAPLLDCKHVAMQFAPITTLAIVEYYYDLSAQDNSPIVEFNGLAISSPVLSTKTAMNCDPHFKVIGDLPTGFDCLNAYHYSGVWENEGLFSLICPDSTRTVLGATSVDPISISAGYAGESCYVTSNNSKKRIKLFSDNEHNIAKWALDEIATRFASRSVVIQDKNNYEIEKTDSWRLKDSENIYVEPVAGVTNKFLSASLDSCQCNNFFVC